MEEKKFGDSVYLVTDDLEQIDDIKENDLVFFDKDAYPMVISGREKANDLLTVDYVSPGVIIFKELPERVFDFFYRRFEMYKVIKKVC